MSLAFLKPSPSFVVSLVALIVALGGAGYSATGGNFILGRSNAASTQTQLTSAVAGRTLNLFNTSASPRATALGLKVAQGHPALSVNTTVKIERLNADYLDGLNSTSFPRRSANVSGAIVSFLAGAVLAGRCADFPLAVAGAKAGELVLLSVQGTVPEGILLYAAGVPSDGTVTLKVCNLSGFTMPAITNLPVRVMTFS